MARRRHRRAQATGRRIVRQAAHETSKRFEPGESLTACRALRVVPADDCGLERIELVVDVGIQEVGRLVEIHPPPPLATAGPSTLNSRSRARDSRDMTV